MAKNNSLGFLLRFDSSDIHKRLKNLRNEFDGFNKVARETGDTIKTAFQTTSLIGFAIALKNITQTMLKASKAETEYIENMNLLQNAYDGNIESAEKLINTMSDFYGLDPSGVTRQLGTYRQMSSALGITAEKANLLSENMIKLQEDVSSLYNISNQEANSKLTSALTGQTKPIRALGADITEASLQQELYNRGINKSVKEMNRASKTILIYLAMERQLVNANGDAARTINSVANQSRIFTEQLAIAGRQIGAVFIPVLKTLLPMLNGLLMALNAIGEILLGLLGIDVSKYAKEFGIGTSEIDMGLDDIGESAGNASEKVKELQLGLRAFDKLNVIKTPTESKSGSGSGIGLGKVDSDLLKSLKEYNQQLKDAKNNAAEIRDKIMKWLGFTKQVDEKTKEIKWKFEKITGGTVLGALAVGGTIVIGAMRLFKILSKIGLFKFGGIDALEKAFTGIAKVIGGVSASTLALVAAVAALVAMWVIAIARNKDLRESMKNIVINIIDITKRTFEIIGAVIEFGHVVDEVLKPLISIVFQPLIIAIKETYYWFEYFFKSCANVVETFTSVVKKLLNGDVVGAFEEFGKGVKKHTQLWGDWVGGLIDRIKEYGRNFIKNLKKLPEKIVEVYEILKKKVDEIDWEEVGHKIAKLIGKGLGKLWSIVKGIPKELFDKLKEKFTTENGEIDWQEVGETVLNALKAAIILAFPFIAFGPIAIKIVAEIVKGIVEEIVGEKNIKKLEDGFNTFMTGGLLGAWKAIEEFIKKFDEKIDEIKKKLKELKDTDAKTNIKNAAKGSILSKILPFADGGFVDEGELFLAREAGPEMVGKINGHTAVANNDQIVEAISIGVAKAMAATGGNNTTIIKADADTEGLLNFIQFKQQQKDRQYGL